MDSYTTESPSICDAAAFVCVLSPHAVADPLRPLRLAKKALALRPQEAGIRTTLGAALYRAGQFDAAIRQLSKNLVHAPQGGTPEDWLFLALAHHALSHPDRAQQYLLRAQRRLDAAAELKPDAFSYVPAYWDRRLELQFLRREAEALLARKPDGDR
jgi:tetratricopeptide (TPR) repeat protein